MGLWEDTSNAFKNGLEYAGEKWNEAETFVGDKWNEATTAVNKAIWGNGVEQNEGQAVGEVFAASHDVNQPEDVYTADEMRWSDRMPGGQMYDRKDPLDTIGEAHWEDPLLGGQIYEPIGKNELDENNDFFLYDPIREQAENGFKNWRNNIMLNHFLNNTSPYFPAEESWFVVAENLIKEATSFYKNTEEFIGQEAMNAKNYFEKVLTDWVSSDPSIQRSRKSQELLIYQDENQKSQTVSVNSTKEEVVKFIMSGDSLPDTPAGRAIFGRINSFLDNGEIEVTPEFRDAYKQKIASVFVIIPSEKSRSTENQVSASRQTFTSFQNQVVNGKSGRTIEERTIDYILDLAEKKHPVFQAQKSADRAIYLERERESLTEDRRENRISQEGYQMRLREIESERSQILEDPDVTHYYQVAKNVEEYALPVMATVLGVISGGGTVPISILSKAGPVLEIWDIYRKAGVDGNQLYRNLMEQKMQGRIDLTDDEIKEAAFCRTWIGAAGGYVSDNVQSMVKKASARKVTELVTGKKPSEILDMAAEEVIPDFLDEKTINQFLDSLAIEAGKTVNRGKEELRRIGIY